MRARVLGWTLAGLGGAACALAVLVPLESSSPVVRLPLDESYETVAEGAGVTFLDPVTFEQRTGQEVSVSVRVRARATSSDADEDTAVQVYRTTSTAEDGTLISAPTTTTACLDRRTAEAVDCASAGVDGREVEVRGLTHAFPPGERGQDRMMWDGTVRASFPARFLGAERFRGLEVERYEQQVPEQTIRSGSVPGLLVGSAEPTSAADITYSAVRGLLVEPVSGVVVSTDEILLTRLRAEDGTPGAVLLGGAFSSSERTVTGALDRAQEALEAQDPAGGGTSWIGVGAGVVLLGLGGLLLARGGSGRRRTDPSHRRSRSAGSRAWLPTW